MAAGELRRTDTQRHTTGVRGRVGERKKGRQKKYEYTTKKSYHHIVHRRRDWKLMIKRHSKLKVGNRADRTSE